MVSEPASRPILVVDDNPDIHVLMERMLVPRSIHDPEMVRGLHALESRLFGAEPPEEASDVLHGLRFSIDSAHSGRDGIALVEANPSRYFLAFVDMRMPPGIDGIETIKGIWSVAPDIYTVICTAYSDYSWDEMANELGCAPNLLILRKPFEAIEVRQIAATVARMYDSLSRVKASVSKLEEELVSAMESVSQVEERSMALLAEIADPCLLLDREGEILGANPSAHDLFGVDEELLYGRDVASVLVDVQAPLPSARAVARSRLACSHSRAIEASVTLTPVGSQPGAAGEFIARIRVTPPA
ncbi:PAS domain-containing protein [Sorangium cellulosum]|uniref:PAS domain-containing protein n=1 Tax=Sorangium TaxID=39643 RepID=UPI0009D71288|nr:PAS domain-containing protein [Sorangium cellulosum]